MRPTLALLALALAGLVPPVARADAVVTLCNDDTQAGPGTNLAAALAAGGRITFQCGTAATLIVNGKYQISGPTEIAGEGNVTLDFRGRDSGFFGDTAQFWTQHIPASGRLTLSGLSLTNASATPTTTVGGSVIYPAIVSGYLNLAVQSSSFVSSHAPIGLIGQGVLIVDSVFTGNDGSAVTVAYAPGCQVTIRRTQFSGNTGQLGAALRTYCDALVERCSFSSNAAGGPGGAIYLGHAYYGNTLLPLEAAAQSVRIRTSTFDGNRSQGGGGAVAVQAGPATRTLGIRFSRFVNNAAASGGAIDLGVPASIPGPPGVTDIALDVFGGSFAKNSAQAKGGAVDVAGKASVHLTRVILADNRAQESGGAVQLGEPVAGQDSLFGDSLFVRNGAPAGAALAAAAVGIVSCTFADNTGGPALGGLPAGAGPVRLKGSIVSSNAGGNCDPDLSAQGNLDSGKNLQFPGQSCGPSIPTADPQLDGMYLPVWNSPAMRAGDPVSCAAAPVNGVDLFAQVRLPPCAIGALEGDLRRPADVGGVAITPPTPPGNGGTSTGGGKGCGCSAGSDGDVGGPFLLLLGLAAWARRRARVRGT
jgi:MYXO-CTERM domain-containing protein